MAEYVFECITGGIYACSPPNCLICKHLLDVFCDYENGPYMTFCEINKNNENHNCKQFVLDDEAITVEEWKKRKGI